MNRNAYIQKNIFLLFCQVKCLRASQIYLVTHRLGVIREGNWDQKLGLMKTEDKWQMPPLKGKEVWGYFVCDSVSLGHLDSQWNTIEHFPNIFKTPLHARTHTHHITEKKVAQVNNKQSPNHQNIQHSIFHEYINKVTIYVMIFTLLLLGSLGYFLHVHTLNTRHSLAGLASGTGIKYILLYRRNIMLVMN